MKQLVITGGHGGLAQAVAAVFQDPEWEVHSPGREDLDVTDATAVSTYFEHRKVDLLVCAAGITRDGPVRSLDGATWDEVFAVNYEGAARCAAAVIPKMESRGGGHVVFISSQSALTPPPGQSAYAASKAALLGLTQGLAVRHGSAGLRFNVILPGFLETRMTAGVSAKRRARILADHTLSRFNSCAAAAKFVRFLNDELPDTSGQMFRLDSRIS